MITLDLASGSAFTEHAQDRGTNPAPLGRERPICTMARHDAQGMTAADPQTRWPHGRENPRYLPPDHARNRRERRQDRRQALARDHDSRGAIGARQESLGSHGEEAHGRKAGEGTSSEAGAAAEARRRVKGPRGKTAMPLFSKIESRARSR